MVDIEIDGIYCPKCRDLHPTAFCMMSTMSTLCQAAIIIIGEQQGPDLELNIVMRSAKRHIERDWI